MDSERPCFGQLRLWIDPEPHGGPWNMAEDQAWLENTDLPVLRVYAWDAPAVTIGYAQRLDALREALPNWPITRRWTGGGVVFHQADFTYSIIVPACDPWAQTRPVESYRQIHHALALRLQEAGYRTARLAIEEDVIDKPFCFEAPAVHDVVMGNVKLAGAGQRRSRLGLLHQGSVQQVRLNVPFWRAWASALADEVLDVSSLDEDVRLRATELSASRYSTESWLLHREDAIAA